jgi:4-alpha-glucanotransferase
MTDILRLDHFRGYVAYWGIPAGNRTAAAGRWVKVPASFFPSLRKNFPDLPFVAEDLGVITQDVRDAMTGLGIPGMEVLQFAFDGIQDNPHLPSNHKKNSLVCTGTHDTNTTLGWFEEEATPRQKELMQAYVGRQVTAENVTGLFLSMATGSVSDLCIVPMQDVLGLGSDARMNDPATPLGNWKWRAIPAELSEHSFERIAELARSTGRC